MTQAAVVTPRQIAVLIVEDNPDDVSLMIGALVNDGLSVTHQVVDTEPAFLAALNAGPDLVLCDHTLPQFSARRAFEIMRERKVRLPVVMVSGTINDELASEFMRQGASDYVLKDRLARLGPAVRNALDRSRLEFAAADANSRLERLMDDVGVGAMTTDLDGRVLACNGFTWRLLGYESEAAFRAVNTRSHYADPADRPQLLALLNEQDNVNDFEVELRRADGSSVWTTGQYHAVKDGSGSLVRIETLLVDSTTRIRAERESRSNRDRLDSALRNAPIIVATFDHDLAFSFAGGTALDAVGSNSDTLLGTSARELLKSRPDVVQMLERALAGEEFIEEGDFAGRYFHAKFSPISTGRPSARGVAVVAVDITARRDAEVRADARARQQTAARELATEALNAPPIEHLMRRAVELAVSTLGVEMAGVYELDSDQIHLCRLVSVGLEQPEGELRMLPDGLRKWLTDPSGPKVIEDSTVDAVQWTPWLAGGGLSTLAVSIRGAHGAFGILSVGSASQRTWSEDERGLLELFGKTLWAEVERHRFEEERGQLIRRLVDAQEQERKRIAADVHDDAVQVMSAATMRLHLLSQQLVDPAQLALVAKLQSTVSLSIERLRSLLFELSPPALELHGLGAALANLTDEFQRENGIVTELSVDFNHDVNGSAALVVYRILQESLINVHKHAHATHVKIKVWEAEGGVWASVDDDGIGFEPAASPGPGRNGHMGLTAMRERAALMGGGWTLVSAPTRGTQIEFWIPIKSDPAPKTAVA
ncbi:MAG TPA: response regulator [Candidatus Micrarchaeaceae archaeon]|nr:response regulator [Candidatus Micrarchaeaceae archaeon]